MKKDIGSATKKIAEVRRKEKEIDAEKAQTLKQEKHKKIESEYNELMSQHDRTADKTKSSGDEEEIVRRPRKTRRRIVVVQSSDTEEEEIEVKLPNKKNKLNQMNGKRNMSEVCTNCLRLTNIGMACFQIDYVSITRNTRRFDALTT